MGYSLEDNIRMDVKETDVTMKTELKWLGIESGSAVSC